METIKMSPVIKSLAKYSIIGAAVGFISGFFIISGTVNEIWTFILFSSYLSAIIFGCTGLIVAAIRK